MYREVECKVCGRKLTAAESMKMGIGPECAKQHLKYIQEDCLNPIWKPKFTFTRKDNLIIIKAKENISNAIEYAVATIAKGEGIDISQCSFAFQEQDGHWNCLHFVDGIYMKEMLLHTNATEKQIYNTMKQQRHGTEGAEED